MERGSYLFFEGRTFHRGRGRARGRGEVLISVWAAMSILAGDFSISDPFGSPQEGEQEKEGRGEALTFLF